ncbi:DnaJ domain-containing protein [Thiohalocapsa sp. ML1]|uniref:DnaJ domain-containing protein n=1 Tax=Thiohalocapsa sp. ML1 TaxID=1431688 RepID=UPI0007323925|nr:DnaJ domain-containing protein [Thiohalocapsa sp. ML1]
MLWWGKLFAGGLAGLIGGPIAAFAAVGVGHQLDRDLAGLIRAYAPVRDPGQRERRIWRRRTALFSVAGALVRTAELAPAQRAAVLEGLLADEELDAAARARAQALFRDGQRADFPLSAVLSQFRRSFQRRPDIALGFIATLMPLVDDLDAAAPARALLRDIAARLGVTPRRLGRFEAAWRAQRSRTPAADGGLSKGEAARILGVTTNASRDEVTRAYRRLLSRHHPDKLAHRDPAPEALAEAARRTDQIRKAYRRLRRDWTD